MRDNVTAATDSRLGPRSHGPMSSPVLASEAAYSVLAAQQYGVVTGRQLLEAGLSPGAIHRRVRAGTLVKMLPGVFRLAAVPRSWHQRALAVNRWAGERSAIGGTAAAALHRLDGCAWPNVITVMTDRSLKAPHHLVIVRRVRDYKGRVHEQVDRIGVTRPVRTLIDIAPLLTEAQLELALEDARRRLLLVPADLETALSDLPPNQPGRGKLLKVLDVVAATRPTDSALEVKVLRLLRAEGYPEPIRQEALTDRGDFAGRVDLVYPERRLIIEVQSHRWHSSRRKLDIDSARSNRHLAMGWVVLFATKEMLAGAARAAFLRDLARVYHRDLSAP